MVLKSVLLSNKPNGYTLTAYLHSGHVELLALTTNDTYPDSTLVILCWPAVVVFCTRITVWAAGVGVWWSPWLNDQATVCGANKTFGFEKRSVRPAWPVANESGCDQNCQWNSADRLVIVYCSLSPEADRSAQRWSSNGLINSVLF